MGRVTVYTRNNRCPLHVAMLFISLPLFFSIFFTPTRQGRIVNKVAHWAVAHWAVAQTPGAGNGASANQYEIFCHLCHPYMSLLMNVTVLSQLCPGLYNGGFDIAF